MQKLRLIVLLAMSACVGVGQAEVVSETLCFTAQTKQSRPARLLLRKYLDLEVQQEVGAFVQYETSKIIPLVYVGDGTSDESVDYELHWLEVVNGKISGEYSLAKQKGGTILGAWVKYKSLRTGRTTVFSPTGESGGECQVRK